MLAKIAGRHKSVGSLTHTRAHILKLMRRASVEDAAAEKQILTLKFKKLILIKLS